MGNLIIILIIVSLLTIISFVWLKINGVNYNTDKRIIRIISIWLFVILFTSTWLSVSYFSFCVYEKSHKLSEITVYEFDNEIHQKCNDLIVESISNYKTERNWDNFYNLLIITTTKRDMQLKNQMFNLIKFNFKAFYSVKIKEIENTLVLKVCGKPIDLGDECIKIEDLIFSKGVFYTLRNKKNIIATVVIDKKDKEKKLKISKYKVIECEY